MVKNVNTPNYVVPFVCFQTTTIKRQILLGYSLIVILALPLWWYTTSIQRLSLPVDRVKAVERIEVSVVAFREYQNLNLTSKLYSH